MFSINATKMLAAAGRRVTFACLKADIPALRLRFTPRELERITFLAVDDTSNQGRAPGRGDLGSDLKKAGAQLARHRRKGEP
jgi:hypothetical protein